LLIALIPDDSDDPNIVALLELERFSSSGVWRVSLINDVPYTKLFNHFVNHYNNKFFFNLTF
jgi:hypothetical protein